LFLYWITDNCASLDLRGVRARGCISRATIADPLPLGNCNQQGNPSQRASNDPHNLPKSEVIIIIIITPCYRRCRSNISFC